jgi:hypothetical protein
MQQLRPWLSVLAFSLLAAGCDEETQPAGIPMDAFANLHREAICEHLVACHFMPDQAGCLSAVSTDQGVAQAVASAQAGILAYDPGAARTCVDTISTYTCNGDIMVPRALRQACDGVFGKRLGEGEACFHASECQGIDAVCEGACTDSCCQGTCKLAAAGAAVGQPCDDMIACQEGAYCGSDNMGGQVCTAKPGPGGSCAGTSGCQAGFACDPNTQTCFKQADSGMACNPDLAADGCAAVVEYCNVDSRTCVPYPKPGEACGANAYATSICVPYADCDGTMCVSRPNSGQACPQGTCIGEGQGVYGFSPTLECADSGTCVARAGVPACVL